MAASPQAEDFRDAKEGIVYQLRFDPDLTAIRYISFLMRTMLELKAGHLSPVFRVGYVN